MIRILVSFILVSLIFSGTTGKLAGHVIDANSGEIIEFVDEDIELLQKKVADKLGYTLVDHRLELYGTKKNK